MGVTKPRENTIVEFGLPMTRDQADAIYDHGREAVIFVLLELAARLAKQRLLVERVVPRRINLDNVMPCAQKKLAGLHNVWITGQPISSRWRLATSINLFTP